jgi:hypothetical protein
MNTSAPKLILNLQLLCFYYQELVLGDGLTTVEEIGLPRT